MGEKCPLYILMIEDNPRDAELMIRALKKGGLADGLVHLRDGAQTLDFCFDDDGRTDGFPGRLPKVILLDLKLPKVDGMEVVRALKADARTRAVPVVVLTSSREESDLEESYRLGVNSYVVKPSGYQRLAEVVCETVRYWLSINQRPARGAGMSRVASG